MQEPAVPVLNKFPFFVADLILLGAAVFIGWHYPPPLSPIQAALGVTCILAGGIFGVLPFVLEYRALANRFTALNLAEVILRVRHFETVAGQISAATDQWREAQEQSGKTVACAREIAERMTAELKQFSEFMHKVNDAEKATMRLEIDKLRRVENEWLQVTTRMLDHIHALHAGALRSNQPRLIEQVGNFQKACRDAARRVGLASFVAEPLEPFDSSRHQLLEGNGPPPPGAQIAETIAAGLTFQGRLIRPALVRLAGAELQTQQTAGAAPAPASGQEDLPLG